MYIDEDSEESSPFVMLTSPTKSWVSPPHNVNKESGLQTTDNGLWSPGFIVPSPASRDRHITSHISRSLSGPRVQSQSPSLGTHLLISHFIFSRPLPWIEIETKPCGWNKVGKKKLEKSLNDFCCFSKCFLMVYVCWPLNPSFHCPPLMYAQF